MRKLLLIAVALAPGCVSPGGKTLATKPDAPPAESSKEVAELPPAEAARAVAATAAALARQGYDAEAAAYYERARALAGTPEKWAHELAVLYDRAGDDARAAAEYAKAMARSPDHPDVLNDLGCFHSARGEWDRAEVLLTKATKADPGHARAWVNLGVVYAKTGRPADARGAFARVLTPAEADYNLGVLLAGAGAADAARERLRAAGQDSARPKAVLAVLDKPPGQRPALPESGAWRADQSGRGPAGDR